MQKLQREIIGSLFFEPLGYTRDKVIAIIKEKPQVRETFIKDFETSLKEVRKRNYKSYGEFQLELFKKFTENYGIGVKYEGIDGALSAFRFYYQNLFLWLGKDITIDLFKVQKTKRLTYKEEEKNELIRFYLKVLMELLSNLYKPTEIGECFEKIVENVKKIDDGLWDLRAMVYAVEDKILQIYLFNEEFFNIKKPLVSIADLFTLSEEKLKEKIEFAKMMGKEYSDEIVDYGIGMNFNKGFLGYCEMEMGNMTIPYLNLPFIIFPIKTLIP